MAKAVRVLGETCFVTCPWEWEPLGIPVVLGKLSRWWHGNHPAFQSDQLGRPVLGKDVQLGQLGCPVLSRKLVLVVENGWAVLFLTMTFQAQRVWSPWKISCRKFWISLDHEGSCQVSICGGLADGLTPMSLLHALHTQTTLPCQALPGWATLPTPDKSAQVSDLLTYSLSHFQHLRSHCQHFESLVKSSTSWAI